MATASGPYFEEVKVGSELPVLLKEIKLQQLGMYAAVCWDFALVHYDSGTAKKLGFRDALAEGPMIAAFLTRVVTDWMGINGQLRKFTANYRGSVFPGDKLVCKGKVTDKLSEGDNNLIECEVWAENGKSERVVYGTATVELRCKPRETKRDPSKKRPKHGK